MEHLLIIMYPGSGVRFLIRSLNETKIQCDDGPVEFIHLDNFGFSFPAGSYHNWQISTKIMADRLFRNTTPKVYIGWGKNWRDIWNMFGENNRMALLPTMRLWRKNSISYRASDEYQTIEVGKFNFDRTLDEIMRYTLVDLAEIKSQVFRDWHQFDKPYQAYNFIRNAVDMVFKIE